MTQSSSATGALTREERRRRLADRIGLILARQWHRRVARESEPLPLKDAAEITASSKAHSGDSLPNELPTSPRKRR